jgi:hypothetical protein
MGGTGAADADGTCGAGLDTDVVDGAAAGVVERTALEVLATLASVVVR